MLLLPSSSKPLIRLSIKRSKRDAIGPNRPAFYRWSKARTTTRDCQGCLLSIYAPYITATPFRRRTSGPIHRNRAFLSAFPVRSETIHHFPQAEIRTQNPLLRTEREHVAQAVSRH